MASETFVRGAAPDEEVTAEFTVLFRGIELSPELAERARATIRQCVADRLALPSRIKERLPSPTGDGGAMIPGLWSRIVVLHAVRDATLRSLLTDPAHRLTFDANAAAMQSQLAAARPDWAT